MAADDVFSGTGGNLALSGGVGSGYGTLVGEIHEWRCRVEPDMIERTTFATAGVYRKWYQGTPKVSVSISGHWPQSITFPIAAVAEGYASASLTLTLESGKTIVCIGGLPKIRQTVNRRSGLNGFEAEFIGRISATT